MSATACGVDYRKRKDCLFWISSFFQFFLYCRYKRCLYQLVYKKVRCVVGAGCFSCISCICLFVIEIQKSELPVIFIYNRNHLKEALINRTKFLGSKIFVIYPCNTSAVTGPSEIVHRLEEIVVSQLKMDYISAEFLPEHSTQCRKAEKRFSLLEGFEYDLLYFVKVILPVSVSELSYERLKPGKAVAFVICVTCEIIGIRIKDNPKTFLAVAFLCNKKE